MLPRSQAFRLSRVVLQALPVVSRAFVGTRSGHQPSEVFVRKNRYMFRLLDSNHDGILNYADMSALADNLKVNASMNEKESERLKKSIRAWWSNNLAALGKAESITEDDFLKMRLIKWNAPEGETKLFMKPTVDMLFGAVDTDGDGIISSKEWAQFFHALRPHSKAGDAEEAFRILDENQDGKLDAEEFYHHSFNFFNSLSESPSMHMFGKVP